jgi:uncharacterized protein (UPF0261 family)
MAMPSNPRILLIGTADTKSDELRYMRRDAEQAGATVAIMDVGILGRPGFTPDYTNEQVAAASGMSLAAIAALGDENSAMQKMTQGAIRVVTELLADGKFDGVLVLGGTMGTDLALDVTAALPLGFPKLIVSTVAYSHLIPADRLAPDVMMAPWIGGLYGMNSICAMALTQAVGALVGVCRTVAPPKATRPRVAISALGQSTLRYMVHLNPALEQRGFESVVFHSTGVGGRSMESLIEQGAFVAVFDFAQSELANEVRGSVVTSGPSRLEAAGRLAIPQLVAPGASDMIDMQTWALVPAQYEGRPYHAHNRLIASTVSNATERAELAQLISRKLNAAKGPTAFLLPRRGLHEWDRPGQPMHDSGGLQAYLDVFRRSLQPPVEVHDLDMHINDESFAKAALAIFDGWVAQGKVRRSP